MARGIQIRGIPEVIKFLRENHEKVREEVTKPTLEHQAKLALRAATRKAPVRTGALKASGYQRSEGDNPEFFRTEIGFSVPYAAFVEEGAVMGRAGKAGEGKKSRRRFLARATRARKKPTTRELTKRLKDLLAREGVKWGLELK